MSNNLVCLKCKKQLSRTALLCISCGDSDPFCFGRLQQAGGTKKILNQRDFNESKTGLVIGIIGAAICGFIFKDFSWTIFGGIAIGFVGYVVSGLQEASKMKHIESEVEQVANLHGISAKELIDHYYCFKMKQS